ncbi:MAG TPA: M48 family metalloprotease [Gammaproteobacteria bacterium]
MIRHRPRSPGAQPGVIAVMVLGMVLVAAQPASGQVQLPDFGDPSSSVFSASDERRIGEAIMREIRASLTLIEDAEVEAFIESIGYRIVSASDSQNVGFTFFVVADNEINAFAAPGGYIGINSGMILVSESESELASVLAHEIAHVTQRHIARAVALSDRTNIPALAGVIAAILIGTQNSQMGQAAAAAVVGTRIQKQIDFTRANEQEADRVGMQLLERSGFDPRALPGFFEKLQSASRYYRKPPEFLSTHPVTTSRIADALGRAEKFPYRQREDSLEYLMVRAKLRVLTESEPGKAIEFFRNRVAEDNTTDLSASSYGLALALDKAGFHDDANRILRELVENHATYMPLRAALADNELRSGNYGESLRIYAEGLELFPDNKVLVRGYSNALIQSGKSARALEIIKSYSRLHALDGPLYRIQAEAYEKAGNPAESHMALAEHYYHTGQLGRAIHQLKLASQAAGDDFYRNSRIEARLKELEDEQALRNQR